MKTYIGEKFRAVVDLPGLDCPERARWPHAGDEFVWGDCIDLRGDPAFLLKVGAIVKVRTEAPPSPPAAKAEAGGGSTPPPTARATVTRPGGPDGR